MRLKEGWIEDGETFVQLNITISEAEFGVEELSRLLCSVRDELSENLQNTTNRGVDDE